MIEEIFRLDAIGYVALCSGQDVLLRLAPGTTSDTTAESNFYEELLVNPVLLKLAAQRGGLDCGGLDYIAVGYGHFVQLIMQMEGGHISMGVSRRANAGALAARVREVLAQHQLARAPAKRWILA